MGQISAFIHLANSVTFPKCHISLSHYYERQCSAI